MWQQGPLARGAQADLALVQDALKVARRLSEEVLKVAGLSEDDGDGKQAAEKAAVEVGFNYFLAAHIC